MSDAIDRPDEDIIRSAIGFYTKSEGHGALRVATRECEVRRDGSTRVRLADNYGETITIYVVKPGRGDRLRFETPRR